MAAILEKIGWSDETEMLAKILSHLKKSSGWRQFLPYKYVGAATYSDVQEQSDEANAAMIGALTAVAQEFARP